MTTGHPAPPKRETLNIRIRPEERGLIDRAAKTGGKNRTDFILDAEWAATQEALLDKVVMRASPDAYAGFLARLDMQQRPNQQLRRTMLTPAPWDDLARRCVRPSRLARSTSWRPSHRGSRVWTNA
jgi:uncharacterized protein (DUF1778 family)